MTWLGLSAPASVGLILLLATALPVLIFGNSIIRSRWLIWAVIGLIVGVAEAVGAVGAVVESPRRVRRVGFWFQLALARPAFRL